MSPERVMFWIEIRNRLRDLHRTVGPKFVRRVRSQNPRGANAGGRLHGGHAGVGDTRRHAVGERDGREQRDGDQRC